jgi:hypothetical protein
LDGQTHAEPGTASRMIATRCFVRHIILRAADANASEISFGPAAEANFETLSPGGSWELLAHPDTKFDLREWWVKSAGAEQGFSVIYQP